MAFYRVPSVVVVDLIAETTIICRLGLDHYYGAAVPQTARTSSQ